MEFLGAINMNRDVAAGGLTITAGTDFGITGYANISGITFGSISDPSFLVDGISEISGIFENQLNLASGWVLTVDEIIVNGTATAMRGIFLGGSGDVIYAPGIGEPAFTFVDGVTYSIDFTYLTLPEFTITVGTDTDDGDFNGWLTTAVEDEVFNPENVGSVSGNTNHVFGGACIGIWQEGAGTQIFIGFSSGITVPPQVVKINGIYFECDNGIIDNTYYRYTLGYWIDLVPGNTYTVQVR